MGKQDVVTLWYSYSFISVFEMERGWAKRDGGLRGGVI